MKPEDVNNFDQSSAFIAESLPPLWRRLYLNCISQGFNDNQAMELTVAYVFASSGGRYKP